MFGGFPKCMGPLPQHLNTSTPNHPELLETTLVKQFVPQPHPHELEILEKEEGEKTSVLCKRMGECHCFRSRCSHAHTMVHGASVRYSYTLHGELAVGR